MLIGDIHSHVDMSAYASAMDKDDELHRPGLHIVVGRLNLEPPDLHIEVTVDGTRFQVADPKMVLAGYHHRRLHEVPQEWIDKVNVKSYDSYNQGLDSSFRAGNGYSEIEREVIDLKAKASRTEQRDLASGATPGNGTIESVPKLPSLPADSSSSTTPQ